MVTLQYTLDGNDHTIALDATVNEQHSVSAEATQHPVETGENFSDYVRSMPGKLTLEAVVTNTPIKAKVLAPTVAPDGHSESSGLTFDQPLDRVRDVYNDLYEAVQRGALFTITTTLSQYIDYACVNLGVPRNAANSNSIQFAIDFQHITTVTVETVDTPAAKLAKLTTKRKDRGNKPGSEATPKERQSFSAAGADFLFGGK